MCLWRIRTHWTVTLALGHLQRRRRFAVSLVEVPNARICGDGLAACSLEGAHVLGPSLGMQTGLEENPILALRVAAEAKGGRPRGD